MPKLLPSHWRIGLFPMIVLGLVTGVVTGVFLGEQASVFEPLGEGYVGLLRMTVLPYIVVSVVSNFARLTLRQGRRLLVDGGITLLVLWTFGLFNVWAFAQALPEWKSGSFFSSVSTEGPPAISFVQLFIPANLFASLSAGAIPAVVTFCVAVGLGLAGLPNREVVTNHLDVLAKALSRVNHFVVQLTPVGVFMLSAHAAGVTSLEEAGRLQAYVIVYTAATLLLTFVVLPGLISTLTPFRYRDIMSISKDSLVTAFATGKLLVVLPLLIEDTEKLLQQRFSGGPAGEDDAPAMDVLYPLAYSVPHMGKVLSIVFIPFAAWFLGNAMANQEYPRFLLAGLASSFGGPVLSIPFLLDMMHLPHDMFRLFLLSGVVCGRLGDVVGVMHLVTVAAVTTCAVTGRLRWRLVPIVRFLAFTTLLGVASVVSVRSVLRAAMKRVEPRDEAIANLQLLAEPVDYVVVQQTAPNPVPLEPGQSLLSRIRQRETIRIGYNSDKLPFAYFNIRGDLVGYDISLAHELARDLAVRIEFVPFDRATLAEQLRDDSFDVVMSGLVGTLERSEAMMHTRPYLDVTLSLVVEDYRARSFASLSSLRRTSDLRIGFVDLSRGFVDRLQTELPAAQFVELQTNREYFEGAFREVDALLIAAENGSAFTLFYPEFEVVIPDEQHVSLPLFYAIGNDDLEFRDFLEHWMDLRQKDGTYQQNFDHWILGKTEREPRWSVLSDVLGWTD